MCTRQCVSLLFFFPSNLNPMPFLSPEYFPPMLLILIFTLLGKTVGIIQRCNVHGHAVEKCHLSMPSFNFSVYKENVPSLFLPRPIREMTPWYAFIIIIFLCKNCPDKKRISGFLQVLPALSNHGLIQQITKSHRANCMLKFYFL